MILMGQLAFLINDNRFGLHVVTQNMFSGNMFQRIQITLLKSLITEKIFQEVFKTV